MQPHRRCATRGAELPTRIGSWLRGGVVALTVLFALGLRPAAAEVIVPLTGTDWIARVTFQDPEDALVWVPTPGYTGRGSQGTLTKHATFLTNDPLVITFEQTVFHEFGGPGTYADAFSGALRFVMNAVIRNQTDLDWPGFMETIEDKDPAAVGQTNSMLHPSRSHFHPSMDMADYTGLERLDAAMVSFTLPLGNGIVPKETGTLTINKLLVHDVEFETDVDGNPIKRSFTITEQPVPTPEPSSLALFGTGLLGLLRYCKRGRVAHPG